jgi:hypothetical protein
MIACGRWHNLALKADGSLWVWGENSNGELGIGLFGSDHANPTRVGLDNDWGTPILAAGSQAPSQAAPNAAPAEIKLAVPGSIELRFPSLPGRTYIIEASTDLLHWIPISTNVVAGSVLTFTAAAATNFAHRIYRVRAVP